MSIPTPATDAVLAATSDEFVRLLIANQPRIYAYSVSLLPNWADADEVFQETGIVLWSKREEFRPGTSFLAWACQIALNKVFNLRKRQARSRLVFNDEFLSAVSDYRLEASERIESRGVALKGCVEKLKPRDRELLEQWYQKRGTTKNMAQQLGRPIDTIYKAMRRIRTALYHCVTENMREGGTA
jgi:RNA polymerase sigma-70 factor (ECF subfamily)